MALWLDGTAALQLRPSITAAVGAYTLVPPRQVRHAVEALHARHRADLLPRLRTALHADAVLAARVVRHGDREELALEWLGDGSAVITRSVPVGPGKDAKPVATALAEAIAALTTSAPAPEKQAAAEQLSPPAAVVASTPSAIAAPTSPSLAVAPPPRSPPSTVDGEASQNDSLQVSARAKAHPLLLDLSAGVSLGGRTLSYTDVVTTNLRTFVAGTIPLASLALETYPLARTHVHVLADLGVVGSYAHSLYAQAEVAGGGGSFATTWSAFDAGLTGRVRLGEARPTLGASLVYGGLDFAINASGQLIAGMPSVSYRYVRPALTLRVPLGRVTLSADSGFLGVLSGGYFRSEFPRSRVEGVDVGVGIAVALKYGLQAKLAGRYSRFFYDLRPTPGDTLVAGGALDEYATGEVALAWSVR